MARVNWPFRRIDMVLEADEVEDLADNVELHQQVEQAKQKLQGHSETLRDNQRKDSVWYTFSDGTPVSIEATASFADADLKARLQAAEQAIDYERDLAMIKLRGPENPQDMALIFDVIENGIQTDPLLDDLKKWKQVSNARFDNDEMIRGPWSLRQAANAHYFRNAVLPNKTSLGPNGQPIYFHNIWNEFKQKLDEKTSTARSKTFKRYNNPLSELE